MNTELNPNLSPELLEGVVSEVLSDTAFIFADAVSENHAWNGAELVETRLSFSGDARGDLVLVAEPALGVEFACNLLGLEPGEDPDVDEQGGAALGEVLNIIAGPLLAAWLGERAVCEIGPPLTGPVEPQRYRDQLANASCTLAFVTEDGLPFEMAVCLA